MKTLRSVLLSSYPVLTHTFTSRNGGVSKVPYQSNNLAFHVGDKVKDVLMNHKDLAQKLGYELSALVHMRQIHSDKIIIVDPEVHNFDNPPECDALITNLTDIPLMVMVADCTPVLIFDPVQKVIAVAHAGRAGAIKGIIPKTIQKMHTSFGSSIDDILVVLGPSIGSCCYEVGEKIAEEVTEQGCDFAVKTIKGHFFLDVNAILHHQLQQLGLNGKQVEDKSVCNACHHDTYFSYRADQQVTGRFSGLLMLHKEIM